MAKNIVICCDGTNNQIDEYPSNVMRLFTALQNDGVDQVVFYDPGVGTLAPPDVRTPLRRRLTLAFGLAFGSGLEKNIEEAYRFLMQTHEEDDRIFLFGFSRGAYTVRGLAGLVHMFGVLQKDQENLIPYIARAHADVEFGLIKRIKAVTKRGVKIEFLGLWDTVSSYGFAYARRTLPFSANNRSVLAVRHALALDERRAYFRQNRWGTRFLNRQDVKEVWFPGVHSDIGGGYPPEENDLARNTLQWMVAELECVGRKRGWELNVNRKRLAAELGVARDAHYEGDAGAVAHQSLRGFWLLLEVFPKNLTVRRGSLSIPFGSRRKLRHDGVRDDRKVTIHQSVFDRQAAFETRYAPSNLVEADEIEPWSSPSRDPSPPGAPAYPVRNQIRDVAILLFALILVLALIAPVVLHAWDWIMRDDHSKLVGIFTVPAAVLLFGGWLISGLSRVSRFTERVKEPLLHLRVGGYSVADVVKQRRALRQDGNTAYRRMLKIDFVFPFVYVPALFVTLQWASQLLRFDVNPALLAVLPGLVGLSDLTENGILLSQTKPQTGEPSGRAIRLSSLATKLKIVGYTVCAALPPAAWILVTLWRSIP